jgi:hypothetical protein
VKSWGFGTSICGFILGHAMSKGCQYSIDDSKVCAILTSVSIKEAQSIL